MRKAVSGKAFLAKDKADLTPDGYFMNLSEVASLERGKLVIGGGRRARFGITPLRKLMRPVDLRCWFGKIENSCHFRFH